MSETTVKGKLVGNAIVWAATMIAASLITKGQEGSETLMMLFIAGWFATNGLIASPKGLIEAECNALRRLFGRGEKA